MRGWRSADSETSPAAPGPTAMPARLRPRRAACRTAGRGVLTAVIAARSITSIKEPEALTFNSNAWFGGSALVPGACYDVHLKFPTACLNF